jgi:hypothetical protein
VPTIHWINRPTFQQAVEVQSHRPRGAVRPKAASPLRAALVPAYKACTSSNRTHGPPLAFASCNPPRLRSDYLTLGTADSNGKATNSVGSVRLDVIAGNPSTPADEADVQERVSITDVRKQTDLSDYTGQLSTTMSARITDRDNAQTSGGGSDPATVNDLQFPVSVPCSATADPAIGGTCSITTTFDSVLPGVIREGDRANWQLGEVQVFDGGSDGVNATSPNTLFARQGVFIP